MCSTDVYCSNKPAAVAPKETITHHFFVSELGRRKLSMQPKFVAAQKMLAKTETCANIRTDCSVLLLRHLYCWKRVCIAHNIAWVAHRYGQTLSALLINKVSLGSSSCFCIRSAFWGWIISFSGSLRQSGEAALSTPEAVNRQTAWCATDDDQRQHHHAEHHFQL